MNLNQELFNQYMQGEDRPLLVEFTAPWCMYCRRLASAMETVEKQYADTLHIGFVNIDEQEALSDREGVEVIPTLKLYRGGKCLGTVVNPPSKAKIDQFIAETLNQ